jgi:tetratricopeptide (TPR) repeat protein
MAAKPPAELDQRVRLQLAMVLQKNGKPDESAGLLQGLLNTPIRDRLTPALLEWLCEYQLGRKEAAPALETAALLVQRGSETNAWGQVGFCLMGRGLQVLGKTAEAQTAFEKALAAPAGNPETRAEASLRLGELKSNGTNTAAALPHFEEAAKLAADDKMLPIRVRAYAGIGKALKAQDDLAGASKYFMSVAVLFDDPELVPECLAEAAAAFKQLGRAEESAKASKELAERYPDSRWNPQKAK